MGGIREEIGATATASGQHNEIASHKEAVLLIMISPTRRMHRAIW